MSIIEYKKKKKHTNPIQPKHLLLEGYRIHMYLNCTGDFFKKKKKDILSKKKNINNKATNSKYQTKNKKNLTFNPLGNAS